MDSGHSESKRLDYLDFLKTVGLLGIMLVHVEPPGWIVMLRNFDVCLMVIVSGILAGASYDRRRDRGALSFIVSRFRRIVFPTWMFLAVYFGLHLLLGGQVQPVEHYLASFMLTRYGIGYVWIMLIYLYGAVLIPLFARMGYSRRSWIAVACCYVAYELACHFRLGLDHKLVETTFYYLIPYGALTWLGCSRCAMSERTRALLPAAAAVAFAALCVYYRARTGAWQNVQVAKYPPRAYYLSYGVMWSFGLLWLCERHRLKLYGHPIVRYISGHSMWIYLWHILVMSVYDRLGLPAIWYVKFICVVPASMLTVYCVNLCLDLVEKKWRCPLFRYLRN